MSQARKLIVRHHGTDAFDGCGRAVVDHLGRVGILAFTRPPAPSNPNLKQPITSSKTIHDLTVAIARSVSILPAGEERSVMAETLIDAEVNGARLHGLQYPDTGYFRADLLAEVGRQLEIIDALAALPPREG